eukprot:3107249-Pleurochrysis_carterae.AAC.2
MPLVGGADPNGTASGDPTDLRFNRPYRASPTGLGPSSLLAAHMARFQLVVGLTHDISALQRVTDLTRQQSLINTHATQIQMKVATSKLS